MLALTMLLSACAGGRPSGRSAAEPPSKLQLGSRDQIGPRLNNYGQAVLAPASVITIWSDEFTSDAPGAPKVKGKAPSFADELAKATGLKVVDHSTPGQTAAAGRAQLEAADPGNLVVICYGYGDAARKTLDFKASIDGMIRLAHARGAPVILVTEPLPVLPATPKLSPADTARKALAAQVSALQDIVRADGPEEGAAVVDSGPVLSPPPPSPKVQAPKILTDSEKQPQSPLARARIAHAVAQDIALAR
jgi:lysophospholipase L1-like esterase